MNKRFIYTNVDGKPLSKWDLLSKVYVLDKENGDSVGFYNAETFMGSDWDNANFFLPVLTEQQLALFPDLHLKKYRISNFEEKKRGILEPIYKQVGIAMGGGLFPTVKDGQELQKLVNHCISEAYEGSTVRKIGKYKIVRR